MKSTHTVRGIRNHLWKLVVLGMFLLCAAALADDASRASIVLSTDAGPLERLAAEELQRYVKTLFHVDAPIGEAAAEGFIFRLGLAAEGLSDQGVLLRPDGNTLLVAGGSPQAVLWAVYELVERWGVRYLVHGDVLPAEPGPLRLPESEIRLEPNLRTRCWRLVNDLADGPVSWSLEENRTFLHQITKMKYNRVFLSFWPCQPFVDYSFQGMQKPPGTLYFGEHFPIDNDTVGREKFHGMTEFTNPDLAGAASPQDLTDRAVALAHGILAEAKKLGMETGLAIQPFEWPKEFIAVLPGSEPATQLGNLTAGPGKDQSMDDPLLREMVATIFRAYIETYPEAEYIHVGMPEHRGWTEQAPQAYEALDKRYGLQALGSYQDLCARARQRTTFPGGGERVEKMLEGDLAALAFLDSLIRERNLLARPDGRPDAKLVYNNVVEELFPLLAKMLPPGGEVLSFIDYTASRQLRQRDLLRQRPPEGLPANLIFTLADDNVGVLPQLATGSLGELMAELRANGWRGFYTRYWTVGDLNPTVHFLARASWDAAVTPDAAYRDLVGHVCGADAVEPVLAALGIIEDITKGLDEHGLGFGFPVPGMMTKHYDAEGLSAQLKADHARYGEALAQLQTAREHSAPAGHPFLDYLVGRLSFAVKYLDAAESFGAVATAEKAGDRVEAARRIEQANTDIRGAVTAWADVAQDHGDLGAVALLNQYAYRPIRDKRNALANGADVVERVQVVEDGESPRQAAECRGVIVGPGVNQPDPFPGYQGFVGWESPIRLRNGTWLVGFSAGYWHASGPTPHRYPPETLAEYVKMGMPADVDAPTGGRAMLTRSADEGRTWSKPETLIDTPADDRHPSFLELPSGTILCSFFTYMGSGDLEADPSLAYRTHVIRSTDAGQTWQPETQPLPSPFIADESDGPMVLTKDGSALLVINGKPADGGPDAVALLRSTDEGQSWELVSTIGTDHDLYEPSVAELPDGRLVLIARPEGDICWSEDRGRTWTKPVAFGMRLYAPSLYVAKDGTLLCLHGSYGAGGLRAIFSNDRGQTWIAPAPNYGFLVDTSYGYAKAMELPDGSFFVTYISTGGHAANDARNNAVWCIRLRIRPDHAGIELLPAPNR